MEISRHIGIIGGLKEIRVTPTPFQFKIKYSNSRSHIKFHVDFSAFLVFAILKHFLKADCE